MKTVSDCSGCLLKLAHTAASAVSAPEPLRLNAVKAALKVLAQDDFSRIPPAIARDVLDRVCEALGTEDPFAELKSEHNQKAIDLVESWAPGYLAGAADPEERLARAVRAALVGNGMDMATLPDQSDPENFKQWIEVPWAVHDWEDFKRDLDAADHVFYLCDNAGEIAFDRVLVKELMDRGKRLTVSVKGGPALNDATLDDATAVGMDALSGEAGPVRMITTGHDDMGVDLSTASAQWLDIFKNAGMVIAKGQANLECLHECGRDVFFISLIKCAHVAGYYGIGKGSAMLYKGGMESEKNQG